MNILERLNLKLQTVQNMYETVTKIPILSSFFDKMKEDRKKLILSEANKFIKDNTYGN